MNHLVFERLVLLSRESQKARFIEFSEGWNLLVGPNGTGKSSILKSLMWSIGTEPALVTSPWKGAKVETIVHFKIGDHRISIWRQNKRYVVRENGVYTVFSRLTDGLGSLLASHLRFELVLPDRQTGKPTTPPPAFYYTPFYVDQDKGWSNLWGSFARMGQFAGNWKNAVRDYHLGIKGNRWFQLAALQQATKLKQTESQSALSATLEVKKQLTKNFGHEHFAIKSSDFVEKKRTLIAKVNGLREREQHALSMLRDIEARTVELAATLSVVNHSIEETNLDFWFATDHVESSAECPTCGAHYENGVRERFGIADEHDQLVDSQVALMNELERLEDSKRAIGQDIDAVHRAIEEVEEALNSPIADVTFREIATTIGGRHAISVVEERETEINRELDELETEMARAIREKKALEKSNRTRTRQAKGAFASELRSILSSLEVPPWEESDAKLSQVRVSLGGSERSRAVFAWTMSFAIASYGAAGCINPPLVLDSPRQQDLDDDGWLKLLTVLREHFPRCRQLIVASRDGADVLAPDRVIVMEGRRQALMAKDYSRAIEEVLEFEAGAKSATAR